MKSLKGLCLNQIFIMVKETSPNDLQECDAVVDFINSLPKVMRSRLEDLAAKKLIMPYTDSRWLYAIGSVELFRI